MKDALTPDERLWKVRIAREWRYPAKEHVSTEYVRCLVSAAGSAAAMRAGERFAEDTMRPSVKLIGVKALEAATVELPYAL